MRTPLVIAVFLVSACTGYTVPPITPEEAYRASYISVNGLSVAVLGFGGVSPGGHWLISEDHPGNHRAIRAPYA